VVSSTPVKRLMSEGGLTCETLNDCESGFLCVSKQCKEFLGWAPACKEAPDAVQIAFNIVSTERNDGDKDLQIRPKGDYVNGTPFILGKDLSETNFKLELACLEEHDGNNPPTGTCKPGTNTLVSSTATESPLTFVDHLQGKGRDTAIGVAFLVDQSGSTSGIVDGSKNNNLPLCLERAVGGDSQSTPKDCWSDHGSLRWTEGVQRIITSLNSRDPVIVFAQNENMFETICELPGLPDASQNEKEQNCYHKDRKLALGQPGAEPPVPGPWENYRGHGEGRSNLWSSLLRTWNFMKEKKQVARHIVVIADGPDSCNATSDSFQHCFNDELIEGFPEEKPQTSCGNAKKFKTVKGEIEGYVALGLNDMHVSFIHFQAKGSPKADERMQEIACMTGGHYIFLNFNTLAANAQSRSDAMRRAALDIRYSMGGHWKYTVDIPKYLDDVSATAANAEDGKLYSLGGIMEIDLPASWGVASDTTSNFIVGGNKSDNADDRILLRKHCNESEPAAGAPDECGMRCSSETGTYQQAASGSVCGLAPNLGICCQGICEPGKTICSGPVSCP